MMESIFLKEPQMLQVFTKQTLVKGLPAQMECVEIEGQAYAIAKGPVTMLSLEDEWYEDVRDPESVIETLKNSPGFKPDIFTFWQRMPDTEPTHRFYVEWESLAVLPIKSFDHWWNKQIKGATRNMIRKSQKAGVEVREATYNKEFVRGMTEIFNESPVRQGQRFWHYGKDCETIERQFSRFLFREALIGAYYANELIGFVMLGNAGKYGVLGQFISKMKYRDKATNNALMAKTVEVCERLKLPYLIYGSWSGSSLADFKRHSGFEEARTPRYFVPLTQKGKLALKFGLHRGWKAALPDQIQTRLKNLRRSWYTLRNG